MQQSGFSVQVQPLQLTIHNGGMMLVTGRDGWIHGGDHGLFAHDTKYLTGYTGLLNGFAPTFVTAEEITYNSAILTYTNRKLRAGAIMVDDFEIFLRITRVLSDRYHERFELTSYVKEPVQLDFTLFFEASFEPLPNVRTEHPVHPRVVHLRYDHARQVLSGTYRDTWFSRHFDYHIVACESAAFYTPRAISFHPRLKHGETWRLEVEALFTGEPLGRFSASQVDRPLIGPDRGTPPALSVAERVAESRALNQDWHSRIAQVDTPNPTVQRAYAQAANDLASLRLDRVGDEWYPAAGVPWFNCIFGRDALTVSLQGISFGWPFPRAVLTRLAQLQGTVVNLWNDEEPGKIPHQLRTGQMSLMGKIPFNPFYGTVDASLLYVILLSETYRFTGDRRLLEEFVGPMDGCLEWAQNYGDIDGDGFIEYWMRSAHDYHNQGWKDAGDAVLYPDGSIVPDPIAIVEVQGYYFDALRRAAEIYQLLGQSKKADAASERAESLHRDFNARYWLPDEQFYAYGLDPWKRPIPTIASNPGQLLWTGIVPPERTGSVTRRLFAEDLYGGWGVRTLSTRNPAYDPLSYQRGSVWPQDNAIIALGMKRCGHWEATNRIAEGIFAASGFFALGRLPELWAGLDREATRWPVLYPLANIPQAWAAGSIPMLLRAILGIEPDITRRRLLVAPTLPEWLDQLVIRNVPFAGGTLDLRLSGVGQDSRLQVLRSSGPISAKQVAGANEPYALEASW